jgi:hypothetical protein
MLEDTIAELIEIYLRRAGVDPSELLEQRKAIQHFCVWLTTLAPDLTEERIEDQPLEW